MPEFIYQNTKINYTVHGRGSAIILLHGLLANMKMWDKIIPELSKKRKVIAIDLFGHGKTECFGYVHTMEEQAKMIKALLKILNVRKVMLIGHSMGGYVALAFADLFPKNTKGICLMNSTAFEDSIEKKVNRDRAIKAVKQDYKSFVKLSIPLLFSVEKRKSLSNEIKVIVSEALNTPKQGIIASLEGMKNRTDKSDMFIKGEFKKVLILGVIDTVLPIEVHKKQVENSNVLLIELPHGHMTHIESFNLLIDSLISFITL